MSLAQRMLHYLADACGVDHPKQQHFLLAVSGGKDSVVMAHLFAQTGLSFGIGHCNFQLRGKAADEDAAFVEDLARQLNCPFHQTAFDTLAVAEQLSVSVQMAARELRYEWLENIREASGYDYVATAHHLTDAAETQIFHLVRGTGLRGLLGIPPRNGWVVRPLLFASQQELSDYQEANDLPYREDSSNTETKYTRNFIRHRVLPAFRELNPRLEQSLGENMQRFRESLFLMEQMLNRIEEAAKTQDGDRILYQLDTLKAFAPALPTVLFELLSPFGLNTTQANDLASGIHEGQPGKVFLTPTHEIALAAEVLEVVAKGETVQQSLVIEREAEQLRFPGGYLYFQLLEKVPEHFSEDPKVAYFDFETLAFPLMLRKWRAGDQFQPFGMGGKHQKVQDYFSNHKFTRAEKAAAWMLADDSGTLLWVVGHRSNHANRVRPSTKQCLKVSVLPD
ncbi:MAG: tRNA lysidine(34) synthetase TilS [Phaeodactylibacter xiamenensis]|uniref:tRNA lysidine(34) synthetase TilS n=1 Tax=Phaeodactylibacter xiamenensis TaxID=1524460 RepID=UPI0006969AD7|nr:tRNA lysidine(34) synthetase TilS [Phaeodactylibacter xiamenensis]